MSKIHEVLIIGGGSGGLSVAARLLNQPDAPQVTILEPAEHHYYQPLWTLVGGGVFPREASARPMASVMPRGATWLRERVESFAPETHEVVLAGGRRLAYRYLVVAPGIQLNWGDVEGLPEALGHGGVCSNYSYETVPYTWEAIQSLREGNAVFTFPATPIKCAGAPQKIMYLAEEALRRRGVRSQVRITYASATPGIFGVPKYAAALSQIVAARDIHTEFRKNLVALRPASKEAVFRDVADGSELLMSYDMIHVTPPQGAPSFVASSPLADGAGWVEVDQYTLQHVRYPDVFSLGDASSLPCSKTGAAIRKQAPILVQNLLGHRAGRTLDGRYDGYASCPLVTGYGKVILAEFGYGGKILESFPFDQARERYSMYALKAHGLPSLYWNGMLQGRI